MPAGSDDGNADASEGATSGDGDDRLTLIDGSDSKDSGDGSQVTGEPGRSPERPGEVAEGGDQEWQFPVAELGDKAEEEQSGNVAGTLATREPVVPGDIDPENALFFLVGAVGTILFVVLAVGGL
jgi:hypothetical protein